MLDLSSIKASVDAIAWIATLGGSDVRNVRDETDELLQELSRSLKSLWDVTREITRLSPSDFNEKSFEAVYDYFKGFYLDPADISKARTHCGNVERTVGRIKFKLASILHTDMGKWEETSQHLGTIIGQDGNILDSYDRSIAVLNAVLQDIYERLVQGDREGALAGIPHRQGAACLGCRGTPKGRHAKVSGQTSENFRLTRWWK
jgi:hypothetical protein